MIVRSYRDFFPDIRNELPRAFDVIGDLCIIKIPGEILEIKSDIGEAILKANKHIKVVLLDRGVRGDLRVRDLEFIAGDERTSTEHREFGSRYRLDLAHVYFSPRLSGERERIASLVSPDERVLDMFCGVGPFTIPAAKRAKAVSAVDLNAKAIEFLNENVLLNKVRNVTAFCGDARRAFEDCMFDRIIMNLPQNSMDFLESALRRCERGVIHLYWICDDPVDASEIIKREIERAGREVNSVGWRELHGYSAREKLFCFDINIREIC